MKIRCSHCQAPLRLPDSFTANKAKCPKCGGRVDLTTSQDFDKTRYDSQDTTAEFKLPSEPAADQLVEDESVAEEGMRNAKRSVAATIWRLCDFKFKRYLTPWIIRVTWLCVLLLVAVWFLLLSGSTVLSWLATESSSREQPSLDTSSLDGLLDQLDGQSLLGSSLLGGSAKQRPGFIGSVERFAWKSAQIFTAVVSMFLFVLWSRAMLEMVVVIFDISETLKRIDSKTND